MRGFLRETNDYPMSFLQRRQNDVTHPTDGEPSGCGNIGFQKT